MPSGNACVYTYICIDVCCVYIYILNVSILINKMMQNGSPRDLALAPTGLVVREEICG